MPYIIAEPCINVKDRSCVDVCPVDCIYEGEDQLYIHPDECIDCGACEPECPVTAIFPEEDTPPQWKAYVPVLRDVGLPLRRRVFLGKDRGDRALGLARAARQAAAKGLLRPPFLPRDVSHPVD